MKRWKTAMCLAGVCTLTFTAPLSSLAALSDYDAETAAKLQDNKLEYGELENLLKEYNPQFSDAYRQLDFTRDDTAATARAERDAIEDAQYKEQLKTLREKLRQIQAMPESDIKAKAIGEVTAGIKGIETIMKLPGTTTTSTDKSLENAKKQIDSGVRQALMGVQQMMIAYDGLRSQSATLEKVEELQKASLEAAKLQQSTGLGTAADVMSSESSLLSTQANLEKLRGAADDLRSSLCMLTGWAADASPEIGPIPAADEGRLDTIDLQTDIVKAIGNNQTLISQRHGSSAKSTSAINNRLAAIEESEQQLKIEMERLYQDMQQKRIAYDAAMAAFQKAEIANQAAERQFQLGMLSKIQYIGAQVQYLQAESARKSADLDLFKSVFTYDWAVQGYVTLPD